MWRPESWFNPYLQQDDNGDFVNSRVFEAGADAMLEAIRKLGASYYDPALDKQLHNGKYTFEDNGIRVFIPDEEE